MNVVACDKCKKTLIGDSRGNRMDIVIPVNSTSLKVRIMAADDAEKCFPTRPADLCQDCATGLLTYALEQVKAGTRVSAGVSGTEPELWYGPNQNQ